MRWKIYFLFITLLQVGVTVDILFRRFHEANIFMILHTLIFYFAIFGLFAYMFKKNILPKLFWKYFFWFTIALFSSVIFYAIFPQVPAFSFLSVLFYKTPVLYSARLAGALFGPILFAPTLYANYQLSQGKFYEAKESPKQSIKVSVDKKDFRWGMPQIALWGYSSVVSFFFLLLSLFPANGSDKTSDQLYFTITVIVSIIFAPILIFWLWVVIKYKQYTWNWWRTTLAANALLLSGVTVFGEFGQQSNDNASGFDFIGILQLLILFVSLYVFGKDQFKKKKELSQESANL